MPRRDRSPGEIALAALPSLGPVSARMLAEAGVPDVEHLRQLGPIECFRRLRFRFGRRVTFNFVYALECASCELDWRLLTSARKAELRRQAQTAVEDLDAQT